MTLVNITLSDEEQGKLLELERRFPVTLGTIAGKIRQARMVDQWESALDPVKPVRCGDEIPG